MSANIVYAILVTSLATFLSRFLGVLAHKVLKKHQNYLNGLIV
jgi:hypothetical protein